ncbi:hypothetical protein BC830DRAFT_1115030 [Chytriomyces sp. MP71]|nr:hypothetical protein BC830DRAFT_1115030 [Chytriomyces sp. MP71]
MTEIGKVEAMSCGDAGLRPAAAGCGGMQECGGVTGAAMAVGVGGTGTVGPAADGPSPAANRRAGPASMLWPLPLRSSGESNVILSASGDDLSEDFVYSTTTTNTTTGNIPAEDSASVTTSTASDNNLNTAPPTRIPLALRLQHVQAGSNSAFPAGPVSPSTPYSGTHSEIDNGTPQLRSLSQKRHAQASISSRKMRNQQVLLSPVVSNLASSFSSNASSLSLGADHTTTSSNRSATSLSPHPHYLHPHYAASSSSTIKDTNVNVNAYYAKPVLQKRFRGSNSSSSNSGRSEIGTGISPTGYFGHHGISGPPASKTASAVGTVGAGTLYYKGGRGTTNSSTTATYHHRRYGSTASSSSASSSAPTERSRLLGPAFNKASAASNLEIDAGGGVTVSVSVVEGNRLSHEIDAENHPDGFDDSDDDEVESRNFICCCVPILLCRLCGPSRVSQPRRQLRRNRPLRRARRRRCTFTNLCSTAITYAFLLLTLLLLFTTPLTPVGPAEGGSPPWILPTDKWRAHVPRVVNASARLYAFELEFMGVNWGLLFPASVGLVADLEVFVEASGVVGELIAVGTSSMMQRELLAHVTGLRQPVVFAPRAVTLNATGLVAIDHPKSTVGKIIYMNYPYKLIVQGSLQYTTAFGFYTQSVPLCSAHLVTGKHEVRNVDCEPQRGGGNGAGGLRK